MYVKNASIEDIPAMLKIMRDVLYPILDRSMAQYESTHLEKELKNGFHRDRFSLLLHGGKCVGFIWLKEETGERHRPSLKVKVMAIQKIDGWEKGRDLLLKNAADCAHSRGLDSIQLLRIRKSAANNVYCDFRDECGLCRTGPGK